MACSSSSFLYSQFVLWKLGFLSDILLFMATEMACFLFQVAFFFNPYVRVIGFVTSQYLLFSTATGDTKCT